MESQAKPMGFMPQHPRLMPVPRHSQWALSCLVAKHQVSHVLFPFRCLKVSRQLVSVTHHKVRVHSVLCAGVSAACCECSNGLCRHLPGASCDRYKHYNRSSCELIDSIAQSTMKSLNTAKIACSCSGEDAEQGTDCCALTRLETHRPAHKHSVHTLSCAQLVRGGPRCCCRRPQCDRRGAGLHQREAPRQHPAGLPGRPRWHPGQGLHGGDPGESGEAFQDHAVWGSARLTGVCRFERGLLPPSRGVM